MRKRAININNVILLINTVNFVAILVLDETFHIVRLPLASEKPKDLENLCSMRIPVKNHIVKLAHGPIANEDFDYVRELVYEMGCSDATN